MKKVKDKYKNQEIPEELSFLVNNAINSKARKRKSRFILSAAACIFFLTCFITLVNTNKAFAKGINNIPLLSDIANIVRFEHTTLETKKKTITNVNDKELEKKINEEITKRVNDHVKKSQKEADRLIAKKRADNSTSSLNEKVEIFSDYIVYFANQKYLSFSIFIYESMAPTYTERYFYNIDLRSNKVVTLKDLFMESSDYVKVLSEEVERQILERKKDNNVRYFEGKEEFNQISPSQKYYWSKEGEMVLYFSKYEIAAGNMSEQEFTIPRKLLKKMLKQKYSEKLDINYINVVSFDVLSRK